MAGPDKTKKPSPANGNNTFVTKEKPKPLISGKDASRYIALRLKQLRGKNK